MNSEYFHSYTSNKEEGLEDSSLPRGFECCFEFSFSTSNCIMPVSVMNKKEEKKHGFL